MVVDGAGYDGGARRECQGVDDVCRWLPTAAQRAQQGACGNGAQLGTGDDAGSGWRARRRCARPEAEGDGAADEDHQRQAQHDERRLGTRAGRPLVVLGAIGAGERRPCRAAAGPGNAVHGRRSGGVVGVEVGSAHGQSGGVCAGGVCAGGVCAGGVCAGGVCAGGVCAGGVGRGRRASGQRLDATCGRAGSRLAPACRWAGCHSPADRMPGPATHERRVPGPGGWLLAAPTNDAAGCGACGARTIGYAGRRSRRHASAVGTLSQRAASPGGGRCRVERSRGGRSWAP
jgi:hypothetical protein